MASSDHFAERIDCFQELREVVAADVKLVIAAKTAALPEQQVAALVPGDQHVAGFEPARVWSPLTPALARMGVATRYAPPSVQALTLAAQAFLMETEATGRAAEALGATTAAIAWRKVVSALVARPQIEFVEGHRARSR